MIEPLKAKNGLLYVLLYDDNCKAQAYFIDRLVCEYFIDNPKDLRLVKHINGNLEDNSIVNLKWSKCGDYIESDDYINDLLDLIREDKNVRDAVLCNRIDGYNELMSVKFKAVLALKKYHIPRCVIENIISTWLNGKDGYKSISYFFDN